MELGYYELKDIARFLGTLQTCQYLGVTPKLSDTDYYLAASIEAKINKIVKE